MSWESDLTEEQRRYLDIMRNNGVTLLDLINDILDLAKVESGQLRFEEVDFDIRELIDKAAETMGMRAHEKHLELAGHVASEVPYNLVGDPLRLRQVLVNLLSNAVKFTDRGEVVLSVEMARPDTGTGTVSLRFLATDTGIGIPSDKTESIFGAFTQADSFDHAKVWRYRTGPHHRQASGRDVSRPGGRRERGRQRQQVQLQRRVQDLGLRLRRQRWPPWQWTWPGCGILVVDDTAANRMILIEALTSQGVVVTSAESGQGALDEIDLAAATGESYQAVLLDCRMPAMDGIEVADQIRHREQTPLQHPIIMMLTSEDLDATKARARAVGVEVYMIKPIKRSNLFEALRRALGAAGATATGASPADWGLARFRLPATTYLRKCARSGFSWPTIRATTCCW